MSLLKTIHTNSPNTNPASDVILYGINNGGTVEYGITIANLLKNPGAIGGGTPAAGSFTTLTVSSKVLGTTDNGYLDLFGDSGATLGVRISDAGNLTVSGTGNSTFAGNVGIGIVSANMGAWNSGFRVIEFGASAIMGATGSSTLVSLSNAHYNSSGEYRHKTTGAATRYSAFSGSHIFSTAVSAAADATVTFVEVFRTGASANLLLGGTTEAASATKALHLFNGVAASAAVADGIVIQSEDMSAGNTILSLRVEGTGSVVTETITPDTTIRFKYNGVEYKWAVEAV